MKTINAQELQKRLKLGEVLLIDVREPAEYKSECIEGAHLIPLAKICYNELPTTTHPIVLHCLGGKRSEEACKKLLAQDPKLDICFLEGGITAWKEAGGVVKNLGREIFPLNRQIQLVAGALVFSGVILGSVFNPWFYTLSGFVGLGLMFAGITGWCGMAKVLAHMPWNK